MFRKKHRGVSLIELVIVLALLSLIATLALSLISLSLQGFRVTRQTLDVTMQDADFASKICMAVRESGTSFTIPEQSFTEDKLTTGWNYLGLMKDVPIPASVSRTGKAIDSADALVYIEYAGDTAPASVPEGAELLHNEDGYFIRSIIGHSYTDVTGVEHNYSLVFTPTDPYNRAAQTISYTFKSTTEDGRDGVGASIETLLEAVNAIQVVYQGSETNPAVAIAFRSDFLPTLSVNSVTSNKLRGTVVLVLDVSSSMTSTRISTLRSTAKDFVTELSKNNELNILITVFAGYANKSGSFKNNPSPLLTLANAYEDRDELLKTIDSVTTSQYTNLGDGLRVVYYELSKYPDITQDPIFLLVLTDGEVNSCTCVKKNPTKDRWGRTQAVTYTSADYYLGSEVHNGKAFENKYVCNYQSNASLARGYYQYFGRKINEEFKPKTYLVSMYSGMSDSDKRALEEVFDETEAFDASSLTQFTEVFSQISQNIASAMWAFEGPRI